VTTIARFLVTNIMCVLIPGAAFIAGCEDQAPHLVIQRLGKAVAVRNQAAQILYAQMQWKMEREEIERCQYSNSVSKIDIQKQLL
jgi:hypothetical protein